MNSIRGSAADRNPTLVLCGTGKTGQRVAERLWENGWPIRIGSRGGEPRFDWHDPASWSPVLRDVRTVYLSYFPDVLVPGAAEAIRAFVDLALCRGVRRLVMLSRRGEQAARRCEQALQASGAEWTILRSSWLCQTFSEGFLADALKRDQVLLPVGRGAPEPFVDAGDVADVAYAALTQAGHSRRVYELTGPGLLSFAEAISAIAAASGRRIHAEAVSLADYVSRLEQRATPADVSLARHLFATVIDGRNACVSDGVQRALGREPRDFADFVQDAFAAGYWRRPAPRLMPLRPVHRAEPAPGRRAACVEG